MALNDLPLKYEEQVIFQLRGLYQQCGYAQYSMSKFEEYELYARNKNFLVSDHILTFTDIDGKLMALKPDVTLSIIKNSQNNGAVQKVYYNENVYRTAPTSCGYREIMQVGLECIGNLDDYTVCEVVALAARSLECVSNNYLLDLSHMGMVSGLLDFMGLNEQKEVFPLIAEKNIPGISALCREKSVSAQTSRLLCELVELYGTPEQVLPALKKMVVNKQMADALDKLRLVCTLLKPYENHLRLDFSIVNDMRYYNGIIFRGYLPGLASGILAGGQYDNLLQRMGKSGQAIGFAVYMDQLERFDRPEKEFDVDVLLLYGPNSDFRNVFTIADDLRQSGSSVRVERTIPAGLRYRECREVN